MDISARSMLMAGVSAVTASSLVIAPVAVPPGGAALAPEVRLAAAVAPQPFVVTQPVVTDTAALETLAQLAPSLVVAPPTPPGPAPVPQGQGLADAIVNIWYAVEPWISYGVDLAQWALGWIPFGWILGDQISLFWYNLVLPVTDAVIVDKIAPIVANPLNLSAWWNGFVAVTNATINGLVDLGVAELYYWFGWILPPCPPGWCALAATAATSTTVEAPTLRSVIADIVLPPVDDTTNALVDANQRFFTTVKNVTEFGLFDIAKPVLDDLKLDFASEQLDLNYTLVNRLATEQVEFTNEAITVPSRFLHDVLEAGQDPLQAVSDQADFLAERATTRTNNAVDAIVDYTEAQLGNVFPGKPVEVETPSTLRTVDVAQTPEPAADTTEPSEPAEPTVKNTGRDTGPRSATHGIVRGPGPLSGTLSTAGSRATDDGSDATTGTNKAAQGAKKAVSDLKKTVSDVRSAVRDALGGKKTADTGTDGGSGAKSHE